MSSEPSLFVVNTDVVSLDKNIVTKEVILDTEQTYLILNYDHKKLNDTDHTNRRYNAVVLDPATRLILSIGSSYAYPLDAFEKMCPFDKKDLLVEEMIEGLSIQLFYDPRMKKWEISTKNAISGNYSYYRMQTTKSPTFREMFFDAINLDISCELEEWAGIPFMDERCCYHFILQHPKNHIVLRINTPMLYYTGCCEFMFDGTIKYTPSNLKCNFPDYLVNTPYILDTLGSYAATVEKHTLVDDNLTVMGVSFYSLSSDKRCFVLDTKYEELQEIRGTHPNLLYQFICLKRIQKVETFLKHFPQYKKQFTEFNELYENLVIHMHTAYYEHFVKKLTKKIHKKLLHHIWQIHNLYYKPSLHEKTRVIIRKSVVHAYLREIEPGFILHVLYDTQYRQDKVMSCS